MTEAPKICDLTSSSVAILVRIMQAFEMTVSFGWESKFTKLSIPPKDTNSLKYIQDP